MKQDVNKSQFADAFKSAGRQDQFSYHGLNALFDHLEEYGDGCDEEVTLDVIALCCEFSEHKSAMKCLEERDAEKSFLADSEEEALELLADNTQVIVFDGGVIIQDF